MLSHTVCEDFFLNQHIFKPSVRLFKILRAAYVSVEDFGGCTRLSVLCGVSVFGCPFPIGFLFTDCILCHSESVPDGNAIGEEVASARLCEIAEGFSGCGVVELRVVGDYRLYVVLRAELADGVARGVE